MARIFTEVKRRPVYVISAHAGVSALVGHSVATGRLTPERPELQQQESDAGHGENTKPLPAEAGRFTERST